MRINNQRALDAIAKERAELQRREALIRSFEGGVPMQLREKGTVQWSNAENLSWKWDHFEYRAKPKPEEFFITVQGDACAAIRAGNEPYARGGSFIGSVYSNPFEARSHASDWPGHPSSRIFKVVEVTE